HVLTAALINQWEKNPNSIPAPIAKQIERVSNLRKRTISVLIKKGKGQEIADSVLLAFSKMYDINKLKKDNTLSEVLENFITKISPELLPFLKTANLKNGTKTYYGLIN